MKEVKCAPVICRTVTADEAISDAFDLLAAKKDARRIRVELIKRDDGRFVCEVHIDRNNGGSILSYVEETPVGAMMAWALDERRLADFAAARPAQKPGEPAPGAPLSPRYDAEIDLGDGLVGRRIVFGDPLP
jgi:hypothetical protein